MVQKDFPERQNVLEQSKFPENFVRIHKILQKKEMPQEQIKFSKRNFVRTFSQETIPPRTDTLSG